MKNSVVYVAYVRLSGSSNKG